MMLYTKNKSYEALQKLVQLYPDLDVEDLSKVATEGEYEEFYLLCNALQMWRFSRDIIFECHTLDYTPMFQLADLCNRRIHQVLGEYDSLYEDLFEHDERWGGDETYSLYCAYGRASNEASEIIKLVKIIHLMGQTITVDTVTKLRKLYSTSCRDELYPEALLSQRPIGMLNSHVAEVEHTKRWHDFMKFVWYNKWDDAWRLIKEYDMMHEKLSAERNI